MPPPWERTPPEPVDRPEPRQSPLPRSGHGRIPRRRGPAVSAGPARRVRVHSDEIDAGHESLWISINSPGGGFGHGRLSLAVIDDGHRP